MSTPDSFSLRVVGKTEKKKQRSWKEACAKKDLLSRDQAIFKTCQTELQVLRCWWVQLAYFKSILNPVKYTLSFAGGGYCICFVIARLFSHINIFLLYKVINRYTFCHRYVHYFCVYL